MWGLSEGVYGRWSLLWAERKNMEFGFFLFSFSSLYFRIRDKKVKVVNLWVFSAFSHVYKQTSINILSFSSMPKVSHLLIFPSLNLILMNL